MKSIFLLTALIFIVSCSHNQKKRFPASEVAKQTEVPESFKKAEARLKEFCDEGHGAQPGWPDLLDSIDILAIDAKVSACSLHKKIGLTHKHNLYMQGFRSVPGGNEFSYMLVDFSAPKPESKYCIATSHREEVPGGGWDEFQEVWDIACKPAKD